VIARRQLRRLVAVLLPLLALRALLPAGYMVATDHGQLAIVMCTPGLAASSAASGEMPAHHHGSKPSPAAADDCPFAHAVINAPPPHQVEGPAPTAPRFHLAARILVLLPPTTGPPRATSARAPPSSTDRFA
jgi:hypothetical protein